MYKMPDFKIDEIRTMFEIVTKISVERRKQFLRWFARQNLDFQLLVFEKQSNHYFKLKNESVDKKILSFASFVLAIQELYQQEQILKSKNNSRTNSIRNIYYNCSFNSNINEYLYESSKNKKQK